MMLKTILIIVISVTIFGVLFFLYVKKTLKQRLDYYLSKNNQKKYYEQRPNSNNQQNFLIQTKNYQKYSKTIQQGNCNR
mgnify:CR=1 FL=1